jgi:YVTN family beta-propeller protein
MRARGSHHVVAGHRGGTSARWRQAAVVAAAAALPLAVCVAAAVPASAAGGYAVTATIEVGTGPDGVAVDPTAHTAYVTNVNDDTVSVIDEATSTVTATIAVGAGPFAVAVDPAAHTAYVTNGGNGTVSVIDEAASAVTATVPVGSGPDAVAVDPTAHTVYVANGGAGTVSVIEEATGTVTATIPVGSDPGGVAVDPAARTAYVANFAGTVSVIDEATGTVTATVPVGADPLGVAVDPAAHTAYVTNGNASTVSVISAARPAPVTTVTSSRNPSTFGQTVTFTATVAPADGGTITFNSGSSALCRAVSLTRVSGSTYHAACTTRALPAGRDTITAVYPGDASYATSAGGLTQSVTRAPTALTARIGFSPRLGITFTATLTASGRPLSGQPVSFSIGRTHLCTADTSTRGVATCALTSRQKSLAEQDIGTIRASYPGSASYLPSSADAALPWVPVGQPNLPTH